MDKLDSQNKINTVKYIIENCERINHTITIIRELQNGYGKEQEQELKFQPESEIETLTKHFYSKKFNHIQLKNVLRMLMMKRIIFYFFS